MILETSNLNYNYGSKPILSGIDLNIQKGTIVGLLGSNGAGKSTLFRLLTGALPVVTGNINFAGINVAGPGRAVDARMRRNVGVVFQTASLDQKLSAQENLRLSGLLYGVRGNQLQSRVTDALTFSGLLNRKNDVVKKFSGGMKRRLELVRAMLHDPALLLMDEPSAGLDQSGFAEFWDMFARLRQERGQSVFLATHSMEEAERCDQLAILHHGKIVAQGTPTKLKELVSKDSIALCIKKNIDSVETKSILQSLRIRFPELEFGLEGCEVRVSVDQGHYVVPRLVEALPEGVVDSVFVRRPSLRDAFLRITENI